MTRTLNTSIVSAILKKNSLNISEEVAVSYLEAQIKIMPDYMRIFINCFNIFFDNIFVLFYLAPFRKLNIDKRIQVLVFIKKWEVPLFGIYLRLFETITLIRSLESEDER